MSHLKKLTMLIVVLSCAFLFGGCYTQLMSYQGEALASGKNRSDCDDCQDVARSSDRREVCVWERDIFGYPELRCYNTNYNSTWMYFHNTPWWYRNSFGWYDTRGCPPYYYYDRVSGICRYYTSRYPPANTGTGSGGGNPVIREDPPVRNSRFPTTPSAETAPSSPPMFIGGSSRPLSPSGSPIPPSGSQQGSEQTLSKPQGEASSQNQGSESVSPPVRSEPPRNSRFVSPPQPNRDTPQERDESQQNQPSRPSRGR